MARRSRPTGAEEVGRYVSLRKARERRERGPTVMQPPLTPMIDVVFQLLLFFLLACQFRTQEGLIPANLPDIKGPEIFTPLKIMPVRVNVLATGAENEGALFRIEETDLQWSSADGLYAYLKDLAGKEDPQRVPVIIKPVAFVRWGHVVNAFNQAVLARFKRIAFAPSEG